MTAVVLAVMLGAGPGPAAAQGTGQAAGRSPVPIAYEPGQLPGDHRQAPRRLAEALAAGLPGELVPEPMIGARVAALMTQPDTRLCVVMHFRSPDRESSRQWLGELSSGRLVLLAAGAGLPDPGAVDAVGVLAGSPYEKVARQRGLLVEPVKTRAQLLQMVKAGRLRYWLDDIRVFERAWKAGELADHRMVQDLGVSSSWLACSVAVPPDVVDRLTARLEAMKADGSLRQILRDPAEEAEASSPTLAPGPAPGPTPGSDKG
ncbi:MAG: hypothetical protein RLY86_2792 [Pseudomonadota bacterium]|jgi:hypothetical protein